MREHPSLRRTTARLADVLGVGLTVLPGGHEGFLTRPAAVASTVRALLTVPDARVSTPLPR
ncbi:hypothetical protein [Lentzea albida]|uniref:hypothetical protein n=1 Tax=Lentzea albida TaxID=65499 RepID=UPI000B7E3B48|nr:hypothetical protein [Lentzea albida]